MSEPFELPVHYRGGELLLPAEFLAMGYTHKIRIVVNGVEFLFEPDEEKNYRAVIAESHREQARNIDTALVQAICTALDEAFG